MQIIPNIQELLINQDQTIADALKLIDANAQGICFVISQEQKLVGLVTDGDIRRAFLNHKTIQTKLSEVMQTQFTSLPINTPQEVVQAKLSTNIRHIPLVDEHNVPVDYACFNRLHRTPIMQPLLDGNELAYVSDCIKTGWISSQGSYVRRFEKEFAAYCGVKHALAVSNGTVALHLALAALDIGPGDEVLVPNITFAASINAIIYTGATPVIVDVDRTTWTISLADIEKNINAKTKAIMPVHLYGHPCHMDEIFELAKKHHLLVVEDCAEAIGSLYKGKHVGIEGDAATFSFFGNKTITTGEGGMVFFKNEKAYEKALVLRDHGMSKTKKYWHEYVGFNYRMTNLQGALGCAQLERVHDFVAKKREIAAAYNRILSEFSCFELPPQESWATCGFWLYTALLKKEAPIKRDQLIEKLLRNGVETRPAFYPMHLMPPYKNYPTKSTFENAMFISEQGISFPSSVNLTQEELQNIKQALKSIIETKELHVK
ncbi:MAG: aminotransferase class I/II-fold pyridoxal phosphate-dependent enzyme [Bacteroidetes bacterium]|nr:aminotransferase class I/II-fold pyridoxal phosphate-dependent enzyme [Bacteroidota bacterium]